MGVPQNGWFIMDNPNLKWMMNRGTRISGNPHMDPYGRMEWSMSSSKPISLMMQKFHGSDHQTLELVSCNKDIIYSDGKRHEVVMISTSTQNPDPCSTQNLDKLRSVYCRYLQFLFILGICVYSLKISEMFPLPWIKEWNKIMFSWYENEYPNFPLPIQPPFPNYHHHSKKGSQLACEKLHRNFSRFRINYHRIHKKVNN